MGEYYEGLIGKAVPQAPAQDRLLIELCMRDNVRSGTLDGLGPAEFKRLAKSCYQLLGLSPSERAAYEQLAAPYRRLKRGRRLYHVVVRNDRTGVDTPMTSSPLPHDEAVTFKSNLIPDTRRPAHVRTLLVEVTDDGPKRSLLDILAAVRAHSAPPPQGVSFVQEHEVDDYPFGRDRTKARWYVEKSDRYGMRVCRVTLDPKRHRWAKPKCTGYGRAALIRLDPTDPMPTRLGIMTPYTDMIEIVGGNMKHEGYVRANDQLFKEFKTAFKGAGML